MLSEYVAVSVPHQEFLSPFPGNDYKKNVKAAYQQCAEEKLY
jgi:hypothetical protein